MATIKDFYHGARPKTLSAAVAPVLVGGALAYAFDRSYQSTAPCSAVKACPDSLYYIAPHSYFRPVLIGLCLLVAVALQVGVNYANDYSDGIKGTDENRVGPIRLVGQKIASPKSVLIAMFSAFTVAAVAGIYVASQSSWWLIVVGAACIALAWFYTGGKRPYGYYGFGELVVFICFGLVATVGTFYASTHHITALATVASFIPGLYSVMILLANNIRDIPTDKESGKKTLAVRVGSKVTRIFYVISAILILAAIALVGGRYHWAFLALVFAFPLYLLSERLRSAKIPPDYIKVLVLTSKLNLLNSAVVSALIVFAARTM